MESIGEVSFIRLEALLLCCLYHNIQNRKDLIVCLKSINRKHMVLLKERNKFSCDNLYRISNNRSEKALRCLSYGVVKTVSFCFYFTRLVQRITTNNKQNVIILKTAIIAGTNLCSYFSKVYLKIDI